MTELHTRRRILAAGLALVGTSASGCGSFDTDEARKKRSLQGTPVHTDLEYLRKRIPELGAMTHAHWQERVMGAWWVPGPSDVLLQAVIVLESGDLERIRAEQNWGPPRQAWDEQLTDELRPFVPAPADWRHSALLEADVRAPIYTGGGDVIVDLLSGTVYLNLVAA